MFNDKFVVGLAYRWSAAVSAMVIFKFLKECILVMGDHDNKIKTTILVPMKYFCVMKYLKIMVKSQLQDSSKTIIMLLYITIVSVFH
jgi:hypothetical protein